jgi:protoporphyrin/coproporphyrin ferrochelatase
MSATNAPGSRVGVVLFQLGGPDSVDAVEPFLYNLFSDPDIIDFPLASIARRPLARLIAKSRARHVGSHYAEIGGRSPILEHTLQQAAALERELRCSLDARVVVAMRYWHPFTNEAIRELQKHTPGELVLLPLYPQYSRTTTGSSLNEWNRLFQLSDTWRPKVHIVREYHDDPDFIDSLVAAVNQSLAGFAHPQEELDFVFSAHSLPLSVVQAGDPYQRQIEDTCNLVWKAGGWRGRRHLCYQSKVGTAKWLAPSMHETIERLAAEGARHLLVVPISFVSDHVETLHEIGIEHREQAGRLGIADFRLMAGLNDSPRFIATLAKLVRQRVAARSPTA